MISAHITPRKRSYRLDLRFGLSSLGVALLASFLLTPPATAQNDWAFRPPTSTGPAVGQKIPPFRAPDQNGRMQDFNSMKGPNGLALYFMRSADW
jgi:hypothetical protein